MHNISKFGAGLTVLLVIVLAICVGAASPASVAAKPPTATPNVPTATPGAAVTYYIDCVAGNDANNGTTTSTPWKTFANVNSRTLSAGSSVLLKRGTTCSGIGSLVPVG